MKINTFIYAIFRKKDGVQVTTWTNDKTELYRVFKGREGEYEIRQSEAEILVDIKI